MDRNPLVFEIDAEHGMARSGYLRTSHGVIETPAFVAVGTQGTVKSLAPETVIATGTQVLFANTYHLYLRPGQRVIADHGGLHRFMNWQRPLMTDSGGFQVFSLGAGIEHGIGKIASIFPGEEDTQTNEEGDSLKDRSMVSIEEEGVRFISHIDGSEHLFTPEGSIIVQRDLGADIILAFDECTSPLHEKDYTRASAERTHRWADRCLEAFEATIPRHGYPQALFGVVQGGAYRDTREYSAKIIGKKGFDGIAIGGNLGRTRQDMYRILEWTIPYLPADLPRHLLGIGDVSSIFEAVERGVDTFDCVSPTRNARNGGVLVRFDKGVKLRNFRLNLRNARFANDLAPLEQGCSCYTCQHFTRAYIRHLFRAKEQLAHQLASIHNLNFMARLMSEIRSSLKEGRFGVLKEEWLTFE
ncbi:MAG: tRNA guanosine(34) transglycosylase Tgt [Deinococcales bacterium]|nr:tRNA guanosine(34) transglycosylase Tgt [Deinococcales bacterium]